MFYDEALRDGGEDDPESSNVLSPKNLDYLDSMGNTSMSELLAMKSTAKSIMNSFNNGHAPLSEESDSLENLKKDVSFNTSTSGWKFSKNGSHNNSRQEVIAASSKPLKLKDEVLFNPDIVAIGLEFCKFFA